MTNKNAILLNLVGGVKDLYPESEVQIRNVLKNGIEKIGLTITERRTNISPTIYVNNIVDKISKGETSYKKAIEEIVKIYEENKVPRVDTSEFTDWNKVKDKLFISFINHLFAGSFVSDQYEETDLDMIYCINTHALGVAGHIKIKHELFELWHISKEELRQAALKGNLKNNPLMIMKMSMSSIAPPSILFHASINEDMDPLGMYIFTSENGSEGAGVLATAKDHLRKMAKIFSSDLWLIPSSINEMIIIAKSVNDDMGSNNLNSIIESINSDSKCLTSEEILSNHAYIYEYETDKIINA